jgi:hypothetical protein
MSAEDWFHGREKVKPIGHPYGQFANGPISLTPEQKHGIFTFQENAKTHRWFASFQSKMMDETKRIGGPGTGYATVKVPPKPSETQMAQIRTFEKTKASYAK